MRKKTEFGSLARAGEVSASLSRSRSAYTEMLASSGASRPWWTHVVVTASSDLQAERYRGEIERRQRYGSLPASAAYHVIADLEGERIGSGGATFNALRVLIEASIPRPLQGTLDEWWRQQRVLIIHSGGDSRRLPQYTLSGKLFSALPLLTPWGEVSTVFDEMLLLSTDWAGQLDAGLVVATGDVLLNFDAELLHWKLPGVCGMAMPRPLSEASGHGVYVLDDQGRVYSFLQKPSQAEVREAGGLLGNSRVALDTGLLRFSSELAARMTELAGLALDEQGALRETAGVLLRVEGRYPVIDLYQHVTLCLTGQWQPSPDDHPLWHRLAAAFHGVPFWCDLIRGEFTHIGTTSLFRQVMTEESDLSRLYETRQKLGGQVPPGMRSAGVLLDSVFTAGGEILPGALAIECLLEVPVSLDRGAIAHGLSGMTTEVYIPQDVVAHQIPVRCPGGEKGTVIRVYNVYDDPKLHVDAGQATWMGRPVPEILETYGMDVEAVWEGIEPEARTLWNARLFPVAATEAAWDCARWMMGMDSRYSIDEWTASHRLSLESSARMADSGELAELRSSRMQAGWRQAALALAVSGSDIRPMLAFSPGINSLAATGRTFLGQAEARVEQSPTEAASWFLQAGLFLRQAGLDKEADEAGALALTQVRKAVDMGIYEDAFIASPEKWEGEKIVVEAPARVDLGGGWTDTPPFCLDWGGTVLNMALTLDGGYPLQTVARRIEEPVIRCLSSQTEAAVEYTRLEDLLASPEPGCPFSIPRAALQMAGIGRGGGSLEEELRSRGGGLEIRTQVNLPMGSGLGTSSILAATIIKSLACMMGVDMDDQQLSDQAMLLEQRMTTGGGWQDQAGGIFPGIKLVTSGPGLRQRLRCQPLNWTEGRRREFEGRFLIYYTGIRRIARNLLSQVVERYLSREATTVQVLHSLKTLANEMYFALQEGEWDHLGGLLDRHWRLNQTLDPNTTNAQINNILVEAGPYILGAKLAGAGGGGFLLLLARDVEAAGMLRQRLDGPEIPGRFYDYAICPTGLRTGRGTP